MVLPEILRAFELIGYACGFGDADAGAVFVAALGGDIKEVARVDDKGEQAVEVDGSDTTIVAAATGHIPKPSA